MSKFDIYLNTEKPAVVEKLIDVYPFAGVCCNPQMVARLGRTDFANIVKELRAATGSRKLFIQTPSNDYDGIMRDAEAILKIAGEPTIIKIPSTTGGIRAMQKLSADVDICATQVMSTLQGMCALQSGVKYISVFYCFMLMGGADDHGLYGGVDAKAVAEMFDAIEKELGSVDVVHNNAGVGGALVPDLEAWDSEHNMDHLEHWKQVLNINLVSQYIVATTAARVMVREGHGGSIINTASLTGHIVNQAPLGHTQDDSSYGVSKAGVLYFTKHFASQVIQYGIRVNSVSPGYCYSPGLHAGMSQEMLECYQNTQPIMRMAQVEELQGAVLYLASDASTYTVGQDILIDGGHANW